MITLPPASEATTVIVVEAFTPAVKVFCATDKAIDAASPATPSVTEKGAPAEICWTADPVPSTAPVAFAPAYNVAVKVSVPTGAATPIEHVRPLSVAPHCGDDAVTSATTGCAMPLTEIDTDIADGDRNSGRFARAAGAVAFGKISTRFPRAAEPCGVAVEPPPLHAPSPQSALRASVRWRPRIVIWASFGLRRPGRRRDRGGRGLRGW